MDISSAANYCGIGNLGHVRQWRIFTRTEYEQHTHVQLHTTQPKQANLYKQTQKIKSLLNLKYVVSFSGGFAFVYVVFTYF